MGTIGEKQQWVAIEMPNLVSDGQGGHKPGVPPYRQRAVVAAHERTLTGREALQGGQLTAVSASVLEIWFREDISVKDRVRAGSRVLEIQAFKDPTDTRQELYLYCSEVQA